MTVMNSADSIAPVLQRLKTQQARYIIHVIMRLSLNGPLTPSGPQAIIQRERAGPLRRTLRSGFALLLAAEPAWTAAATLFVFVSYLMNMGPQYPWIGLGVLLLPLPIRLLTRRPFFPGTALGLPLFLLMVGGLVGLLTSPNNGISLGAFQCMIAMSLFLYSWLTWGNLALLAGWLIRLVPFAVLAVLILALFDLPGPAMQPNLQFGGTGTHHGLATVLIVVVSVLAGIALFSQSSGLRWLTGATAAGLLVIALIITWDSLGSLFAWASIRSRAPIWDETVSLLATSPITGLGLGCWALSYWGTTASIPEPTHCHNAYLELYANTGFLGILALVVTVAIGANLAWNIVRKPRSHPWYGFGIGVVTACVVTLLIGLVESAPVGVPLVGEDTYYYLVSPVPWILAGLLIAANDLLNAEVKE